MFLRSECREEMSNAKLFENALSAVSGGKSLGRSTTFNVEPTSYSPFTQGSLVIGLYILGALFGIVVIAIIIDYYYPFLPDRMKIVESPPSGRTFWTSKLISNVQPARNLAVTATETPIRNSAEYTMIVDLMISDSRTAPTGGYRHILHRGSNDYNVPIAPNEGTGMFSLTSMNTDSEEATGASLASARSMQGVPLPVSMGLGLFLHPFKNDIVVFTQTVSSEIEGMGINPIYLESMAIEDIPLKTFTRIAIVVQTNQLDIFRDGNWVKTLLLKGQVRPSPLTWFGRASANPMHGVVENLRLYNLPLTSEQIKLLSKSPMSGSIELPGVCEANGIGMDTPSCAPPAPKKKK